MLKTAFSFLLLILLCGTAFADINKKIASLAPSGVVLVLDEKGDALASRNSDKTFTPASVAKVVTAYLAMEVLGGDYRFKTRFYMGDDRTLYVKGGGDPMLVSEELALLAPVLLEKTGMEPFKALVIDASYYPKGLRIPGIEPTSEAYDALNTAFAVNFNTINAVKKGKSVRSAEKQTPITPLAISQFQKRARNGRSRISLTQENPDISVRYAGELLAEFIKKEGGSITGEITIGTIPDGLATIYVHEQSRDLAEIIKLMMIGSNNYMANQIFLETGAKRLGSPASLEKSLQVANEIFAEHGVADDVKLVEGSGISPENKFTARGLATILDLFAPHAGLMKKTRAGSRYKTGTIDGVKTLAGYAKTKRNGTVRFVISLGGRTGQLRFRLLNLIEKEL